MRKIKFIPGDVTRLKDSKAHWVRLRDDKRKRNENTSGHWCALCKHYSSYDIETDKCHNSTGKYCPLTKARRACGRKSSHNDEYWAAYQEFKKDRRSPAFKKAAQVMVDILDELLTMARAQR